MNIVIMGPPSSGKGTQAELLAKKKNLYHFSTGDALRQEVKSGSLLGKKISEIMDAGELVPPEIINEIVKKVINDHPEGIIFDGYPRTLEQAKKLLELTIIDKVILIIVNDETVIKRMSSRRICENCGAAYNLISLPPKKQGVCDKCGGKLVMRDDDKPEVIKKRLELYHNNTRPIINYFKEQGINVVEINGEPSIEEVSKEIINNL